MEQIVATGKLLKQLIRSGAEGDLEAFRGAAKQVIKDEQDKHHHLLARDLETILYGCAQPQPSVERRLGMSIPEDRERGLQLLTVKEPSRQLADIVLSPQNEAALQRVLLEHNREEVLRAHGLRPSDRLVLCGPPGCGKTLAAEVIAYELGRPFGVVRADSVVSSFLGETAANLRKVFDFIARLPMVVLFDEFDALGKERDDPTEHGELRRVVNAFLQMLDDYRGRSLIIAATNHEQMLDTAIWRRFDEILVLKHPTAAQLRRLLKVKLRGVRYSFAVEELASLPCLRGASHADAERIVHRAIKEMVLDGGEPCLGLDHLKKAGKGERSRLPKAAKEGR